MTKKQNENEIKRKTVPFGPNEQDLFNYAENQCEIEKIKFATYVKKLIREAKERDNDNVNIINSNLDDKIINILDEYFATKKINVESIQEEKADNKYNDVDKSALLNFMKRK